MKSSNAEIASRVHALPTVEFEAEGNRKLTAFSGLVLFQALFHALGLVARTTTQTWKFDLTKTLVMTANSGAFSKGTARVHQGKDQKYVVQIVEARPIAMTTTWSSRSCSDTRAKIMSFGVLSLSSMATGVANSTTPRSRASYSSRPTFDLDRLDGGKLARPVHATTNLTTEPGIEPRFSGSDPGRPRALRQPPRPLVQIGVVIPTSGSGRRAGGRPCPCTRRTTAAPGPELPRQWLCQ